MLVAVLARNGANTRFYQMQQRCVFDWNPPTVARHEISRFCMGDDTQNDGDILVTERRYKIELCDQTCNPDSADDAPKATFVCQTSA